MESKSDKDNETHGFGGVDKLVALWRHAQINAVFKVVARV